MPLILRMRCCRRMGGCRSSDSQVCHDGDLDGVNDIVPPPENPRSLTEPRKSSYSGRTPSAKSTGRLTSCAAGLTWPANPLNSPEDDGCANQSRAPSDYESVPSTLCEPDHTAESRFALLATSMALSRRWDDGPEAALQASPEAPSATCEFFMDGRGLSGVTVAIFEHVVDAIPIYKLAETADSATWRSWRDSFRSLGAPVIAKLTHAGRRCVEQWLDEVGELPRVVPSLAAVESKTGLSRRALNANDRILRNLNGRRGSRSSVASSAEGEEEGRRRSSTRFRERQHRHGRTAVEDHGILDDYTELEHEAAASFDGDDSSRNTVRSHDRVKSLSVTPGNEAAVTALHMARRSASNP
jgi:hypothetical protein